MTFAVPAERYEVLGGRGARWTGSLSSTPITRQNAQPPPPAGRSSGANPFACVAAGIACLGGPAHGGANEAALNMLRGSARRPVKHYIERAKDKNDPFRLMVSGTVCTRTTIRVRQSCRNGA